MDEVEAYLGGEHPDAAWAVAVIRAADPLLEARVRRGWRAVTLHHPDAGYVCGVFPSDDGARVLFEHGGRLPDPDGLLQGDGLRGRWLPVTATDGAAAERLRGFVHDAIVRRTFR